MQQRMQQRIRRRWVPVNSNPWSQTTSVTAAGIPVIHQQLSGAPPLDCARRHWRSVRRVGFWWIALWTLFCISACSPKYDWREVADDAAGLRVLFPGKPDSAVRTILLGNLEVQMTLRGVRIDQTMFTVGSVILPVDEAAVRERAIADMRTAMVRNVQGRELAAQTRTIPVIDPAGSERARQAAVIIDAEGRVRDAPVQMRAGFVARGNRAWQWVVLGADVDAEQAANFLDSVRLVE